MKMKMKKLFAILLTFCMLLTLAISVNAKNISIRTPEFKAVEAHNAQIAELFPPDGDILFATLMNNKASERTEYVISDIYAWQDNYTDAIFFYEGENADWNDAVHLDLTNNIFSFSLSQPMMRGEELAVIFDDGTSVWINYIDQDDFHNNMYTIEDIYTVDFINVKIIGYLEDTNEYGVPVRYAFVLAEERVASNMPSSGNIITEFTLPGQIGETIIDNYNRTIKVVMPAESDITGIIPESFTYSSKAFVYPSVSAKQNFNKTVKYTVAAEDFTKAEYIVEVVVLEKIAEPTIIFPYYTNHHVYNPHYKPHYCNRCWINEYYRDYYPWWSTYYKYNPNFICDHKLP